MEQPLTRGDAAGAASGDALADAAARLERALLDLEAAFGRTAEPAPVRAAEPDERMLGALDAARRREQDLLTGAAAASQALGRAMAEVRLALSTGEAARDGAPTQGVLDLPLESALESAVQSPEDGASQEAPKPSDTEPAA